MNKKPNNTLNKAIKLAYRFGFDVRFDDKLVGRFSRYEDSVIYIASSQRDNSRYSALLITHEIAHHIVASSSRKFSKDWGIQAFAKTSKSQAYWDFDEAKSYLAGLHIFSLLDTGKTFKGNPLDNNQSQKSITRFAVDAMIWWVINGKRLIDEVVKNKTGLGDEAPKREGDMYPRMARSMKGGVRT